MDVSETGHRHMDVSQTGHRPATVLTLSRTSGYRQRVCLTLHMSLQPSTELPAPLYVCVILDVWLFVTAGRPPPAPPALRLWPPQSVIFGR